MIRISIPKVVPILFGEILPHFYVRNIFLAQKLTKLEQFRENLSKFQKEIAQTVNNKFLTIMWPTLDPFTHKIQSICLLITK